MYQDNPITLEASAALGAARRVTAAGAQAGASDAEIGVTHHPVDSGARGRIRLMTAGTVEVTANAAIAADAPVVPAADGKVAPVPTSGGATFRVVGYAREAAGGDGAIIEIIPVFGITVDAPA